MPYMVMLNGESLINFLISIFFECLAVLFVIEMLLVTLYGLYFSSFDVIYFPDFCLFT